MIPKRKGLEKREDTELIDASKTVGIEPSSTQGVIDLPDESQENEAQSTNAEQPIVIDLVEE